MEEEYGFDPRGPEFLLSPQYGKHFYHRDIEESTFAGSHDSFHETSQPIFGLILDSIIPANTLYAENTAVIDLIPAITEERFGLILNPERRKLRQELRQLFTERLTIKSQVPDLAAVMRKSNSQNGMTSRASLTAL